ncbi:hypothetical protein GVY41_20045 [Frigidibacter albus]|uniref:Uncharacterized protein n=1 Tax=Frigidibacter albus TaxID=1465486 RepID=A0A6L8VLV3_9RHOB|nr:hypothetical protein [Frigidibacter albus]MZQ91357.1 hypothetical protein [Frigidibacter albus]NBE33280.1 hypothetical protein [Frigidibacter albus]GGH64151.1 hypothetical protein GCM10011341_39910 [Frigidibacter albus]
MERTLIAVGGKIPWQVNETVGDPRYPFDLLCRVITVSLATVKIVRSLPPLEI